MIFENQNCIEGMKKLRSKSIDLIVADPPYLQNYESNHCKHKKFTQIINDDKGGEKVITEFIQESYRLLKDNSAIYIFCNANKIDFFKTEIEKYFKIKNIIVWVKNNWTAGDLKGAYAHQYEFLIYATKGRALLNGKRHSDVWNFPRVVGKEQKHPNQKPLALIKQILEKSSKEGDLILDPFAGVGTVAKACSEMNRDNISYEIDEKYYKILLTMIKEYNKIESA